MAEVIASLVAELGFDVDEKKIKDFESNLKEVGKTIAKIGAGLTAATAGIFAFTTKITEGNDELLKTSQTIGTSVESLQELGFAARLNGGSVESMNSSLENLSKVAGESSRGVGAGVEAFGLLGISVNNANGELKSTDALFMETSDAIANLSTQAERLELSQKLGISSDLLLTMQQGSEAIKRQREEAQKLGFVISESDAKASAEFNDELQRVTDSVKGMFNTIGVGLSKEFRPMLEALKEWWIANKELVKQKIEVFFKAIIKGAKFFWNLIKRIVVVIDQMAQAMGGWKTAIIAITTVWALFNRQLLIMPAILFGIFLILEDLFKFFTGGDSLFGSALQDLDKFLEKFPILKKMFDGLKAVINIVVDGWKQILVNGSKAIEGLSILVDKFLGRAVTVEAKVAKGALISQADITKARERGTTTEEILKIIQQAGGAEAVQRDVTINISGGNQAEVRRTVEEALGMQLRAAKQDTTNNAF